MTAEFGSREAQVYALLIETRDLKLIVSVDCEGTIKLGPGVTLENVGKKIAERYCPLLKEGL